MAKKKRVKKVTTINGPDVRKALSHSPTSTVVEQRAVAPCSVELTRDAKGLPKWSIKMYCEVDGMDKTLDEVLRVDARLKKEARNE